MCFFPRPNFSYNSPAYLAGVHSFDCGHCPECLRKRANSWVPRAYYECLAHQHNCMITLTYDNFERDSSGRVVGELPVDRDLRVCKRDVQLFIKRLRKYFKQPIKYLFAAEYGSRTHRAHYHAVLFGVDFFEDRVFYKRSKRGSSIFVSSTLTRLWGHGICTVDCVNVSPSVVRYCTKYTAKSRSDDTFMLFSHQLGLKGMLEHFNSRGYIIDGREYPIPRVVWQHYIMSHYSSFCPDMSPRYINRRNDVPYDFDYERGRLARRLYRAVRNSSPEYISYLSYWKSRSALFNNLLPDPLTRLRLLPDKFARFKALALPWLSNVSLGRPFKAPGARSTYFYRVFAQNCRELGLVCEPAYISLSNVSLPRSSLTPLRRPFSSNRFKDLPVSSPPLDFCPFTAYEVPSDIPHGEQLAFDLPYIDLSIYGK